MDQRGVRLLLRNRTYSPGKIVRGCKKGMLRVRTLRNPVPPGADWLPSNLLPGPQVRWRAVDDQTAEAVVEVDGEQIPVRLSVDAEGRVRSMAMQRWGDQTPTKEFALIPFGGTAVRGLHHPDSGPGRLVVRHGEVPGRGSLPGDYYQGRVPLGGRPRANGFGGRIGPT